MFQCRPICVFMSLQQHNTERVNKSFETVTKFKYWETALTYQSSSEKEIYLLTPWSRVLLEKLTGSAASQEIPRIFGTRRFITLLTSARHLSLS